MIYTHLLNRGGQAVDGQVGRLSAEYTMHAKYTSEVDSG